MSRRLRRAFSLLEVMIAVAILTFSLVVIVRIQAGAVQGALRAERVVTATDLAQDKMSEVLLLIEAEGVGTADIQERGDFGNYGDDQRLDFRDKLDDYRWEYWVEEIEFALSGDAMSMLGGMGGGDGQGGAGGAGGVGAGMQESGMADQALGALGFGPDQLSEQLGQYIRRVRVRVYWGEERDAEEKGREVIITTHIVSPTGAFQQMGGIPGQGGGPGGMGPGGMGPGGMGPGGMGGQGGGPPPGFNGSIGGGWGGGGGGAAGGPGGGGRRR